MSITKDLYLCKLHLKPYTVLVISCLLTPLCICISINSVTAQNKASIEVSRNNNSDIVISKNIYGMFSEHLGRGIYNGFWVGEDSSIPNKNGIRTDLVEAFKKINIPVLRWPGGCFADEYHWKDGIGPKDKRPKIVNTTWGMPTEDNSFGTHEFMELVNMLEAEAYFAGNMGSGTEQEMSQWVEYLNSNKESSITDMRKANGQEEPWRVPYFGVGNENWGCGGNMTPEYYSDLYKRYATFLKDYPGAPLKKIAAGPNSDDTNWTEVLMKNIPLHMMWGLSLHYYTIPTGEWNHKGSATDFNETEYFNTMRGALRMKDIIEDHERIMDRYDPDKTVALVVDEWGIWTDVEPGTEPGYLYQQNSMRDALIAATTLNIFNNHADRVKMANLAQTVNVLQALALTKRNKMLLTPTYYVFDLYKKHQDAILLPIKLESPDYELSDGEKIPAINGSASIDSTGKIHLSLVNLDPSNAIIINTSLGKHEWTKINKGQILTSKRFNDYNTFKDSENVTTKPFSDARKKGQKLEIKVPPISIVTLELE